MLQEGFEPPIPSLRSENSVCSESYLQCLQSRSDALQNVIEHAKLISFCKLACTREE